MTLDEFKAIILTVDSQATRYKGAGTGNYTVWAEYGKSGISANDSTALHAWKVQVDRFTQIEDDPKADAISAALDAASISYDYLVDYEPDTRYIHHIWDCEAI